MNHVDENFFNLLNLVSRRESQKHTDSAVADEAAVAPETEIEITPEMIEAGLEARASWDSRFEEREGLVIQVYEAMEKARRKAAKEAMEREFRVWYADNDHFLSAGLPGDLFDLRLRLNAAFGNLLLEQP